jgi:acetyl-CoA carboxylase biotin carboxyl carrier protein
MDIKHIKNLIQLMVENDMSRVEIQEGETHILLRRGQPTISGPTLVHAAPQLAVPGPIAAAALPAVELASDANELVIRSPMVGTFYSSPDPESPAFVKVGDTVDSESVVCLVEAMKVFNEIKADLSGKITKVLVKNGDAVEFDQPLFAVTPA